MYRIPQIRDATGLSACLTDPVGASSVGYVRGACCRWGGGLRVLPGKRPVEPDPDNAGEGKHLAALSPKLSSATKDDDDEHGN
jgi:hypothetical protein